ncbi:MAG: hypothetical protein ACRBC3_06080 [Burkholderiaceae bacterium]|uniref:hypothetical protein n=1 Tax=Comamonadaceae TaxID=80864 RepID=UPI00028B21BA|nr:hypothetical protein [Acidovorax sp. KKS102]AFU46618.1 hypothetical protein C380_14595 [Acidovorax sp. KKS102]
MTIEEFYSAPRGTYGNALLNWSNHAASDVVSYAVSYRNAAHGLIAGYERRDVGDIDYGACPVIFLFRHAIELYLKGMVYRLARLSVDDQELRQVLPRLWREHSLMKLLGMAQPVLAAMRDRLPLALRAIDEDELQFLSDLDRVDPGSYSFRYPVASTGGSALQGLFMTNIFVFAQMADRTLDSLNAICRHLIIEVHALEPQMRLNLGTMDSRQRG